jgi:DNA-directed RNA polymerase subunit RPC12/RpoP
LKVGEDIECGNCGQPFSVELEPDGRYLFVPLSFSWVCAACDKKCEIPQGRAKDGLDVSCKNCGDHVTLALERQWRLVRLASKEAGDGNTRPAELE